MGFLEFKHVDVSLSFMLICMPMTILSVFETICIPSS